MRRICIIDDDEMYQYIITRQIVKLCPEAKVISYRHGTEAIEALKALATGDFLPWDVILLDINMPVMDGWQFLGILEAMVSEIGKMVDIYVVSTSVDTRDTEKALADKNVKAYISKPIPADKLLQIIQGGI